MDLDDRTQAAAAGPGGAAAVAAAQVPYRTDEWIGSTLRQVLKFAADNGYSKDIQGVERCSRVLFHDRELWASLYIPGLRRQIEGVPTGRVDILQRAGLSMLSALSPNNALISGISQKLSVMTQRIPTAASPADAAGGAGGGSGAAVALQHPPPRPPAARPPQAARRNDGLAALLLQRRPLFHDAEAARERRRLRRLIRGGDGAAGAGAGAAAGARGAGAGGGARHGFLHDLGDFDDFDDDDDDDDWYFHQNDSTGSEEGEGVPQGWHEYIGRAGFARMLGELEGVISFEALRTYERGARLLEALDAFQRRCSTEKSFLSSAIKLFFARYGFHGTAVTGELQTACQLAVVAFLDSCDCQDKLAFQEAALNLLVDPSDGSRRWAARLGYTRKQRGLLQRPAADIRTYSSLTQGRCLHVCGEHGFEKAATQLIGAGIPVDRRDEKGRSALHCSLGLGHESFAEMLVRDHNTSLRVDKPQADGRGNTLIHECCRGSCEGFLGRLLSGRTGAQISLVNHQGQTPIHLAIANRNERVANRLIDAGATLTFPHPQNRTLLHDACYSGCAGLAARMVASLGFDVNAVTKDGHSPVYEALRGGHGSLALRLLESPYNANPLVDGFALLRAASGRGLEEIVAILLAAGVCPNRNDRDKKQVECVPPVWIAYEAGHIGIMRRLLEAGANPDAPYSADEEEESGRLQRHAYLRGMTLLTFCWHTRRTLRGYS
jgi:ankyrin repeat protein